MSYQKRTTRIVLFGYYGCGNLGDDLMLTNLLDWLLRETAVGRITVFCRVNYYGSRERVRFIQGGKNTLATRMLALAGADLVAWGGGTSLFDDVSNRRGLLGMLRVQRITRLTGGRFFFLGIGVGDFATEKGVAICTKLLKNADGLFFRDKDSRQKARNTLNYYGEADVGGDMALLVKDRFSLRERNRTVVKNISFSGLQAGNEGFTQLWGENLSRLASRFNAHIHFIPAQFGLIDDNLFHSTVALRLPADSWTIHGANSPESYVDLMRNMDLHIGVRLHSIIAADMMGVPSLGIARYPKMSSYLAKSAMMTAERTVLPDGIIDHDRVQRVFNEYVRPVEFMNEEARTCALRLKELFKQIT